MEIYEAQCGVYLTHDIARLYKCSTAQVPALVDNNTIPKPMAETVKGQKRRWKRSAVDKDLGIQPFRYSDVQKVIREEVQKALAAQTPNDATAS